MNQEEIEQTGMHVITPVTKEEADTFAENWAYENAFDEHLREHHYPNGVEVAYLEGWIIYAKQQGGLFGDDSIIAWAVAEESEQ